MKNNIVFLLILMIILFSGCEKAPSKDNDSGVLIKHTFLILCRTDTLTKLVYNDSMIFSYKLLENNKDEETFFHYKLDGLLSGVTIKNLKYKFITYKDFTYDSLKRISSINIRQIFQNGDSLKDIQILDYDAFGQLVKINSVIPETFEYVDNNVSMNGNVNDNTLIWTDYSYTYDKNKNPIFNRGLPLISAKQISQNNILTKISKWVEYPDCMMPSDTVSKPITHIDTIYTSTFVYNLLNEPILEYRKYKKGSDTLRYLYE